MALSDNERKKLSSSVVTLITNTIMARVRSMINGSAFDRTFRGRIMAVVNGAYTVKISDKEYQNVPAIVSETSLKAGDVVMVRSPCNNMSDMYIEGKLTN